MKIGDAYKSGNLTFVVNSISPNSNVLSAKCIETDTDMKFKLYGKKYFNTDNTNIQLGEKCNIGQTLSPNISGKITLLSKYKLVK